jgi:hypothetical protein
MAVIANLDSVEGQALVQEAVTFVSVSNLCLRAFVLIRA